ncbi:MAG TPA: O-antigen ligase family protein [Bacteroidia bacterium]|nr:O-antigen ligase family protein [Bacteroidia bacterium]HNT79682.1 O-antigen ligase family protein [Bacteroidia bacterium]
MPVKTYSYQKISAWLIFILLIRIISYFMVSESVAITQGFKIGSRVMLALWCFVWYRIIKDRETELKFQTDFLVPIFFYLAYLFLGLLSLIWTSSIKVSALQLLMDVEQLVFSFFFIRLYLLLNEKTGVRFSNIMYVSIFMVLLGFIAGMYINPDKFYRLTHGGEVARLGGFIINPNELGMLIVIGIGMSFFELQRQGAKVFSVVALLVLFYTLYLTGSRSSMIGALLVSAYFIIKSNSALIKTGSLVAIIIAAPFVFTNVFLKQGDMSEVMDMTGRLPFWKDLLTMNFPKEPWLGFGFMRIDYYDRFESLNSYAGAMTHNTFIQVLLNLGIIGFTIAIIQLAFTIHAMIRTSFGHLRMISIAIFCPVIINSFTEFGIFGETNYGIMFYLFIVFLLHSHITKREKQSRSRLRNESTYSLFRPVATA